MLLSNSNVANLTSSETVVKRKPLFPVSFEGRGGYTQAFSQAGEAKEMREKGTKRIEVCVWGVIFFPCRSPIPCFFFWPLCFSRASPAHIEGNENECYAVSQIYESKSCIRLTGRCYRLTSEIMQSCQHFPPAWRLLAGKWYYCFLSCVHEVSTMSEVTNISVYCHRKIPEIQQSLM